MTKSLRNLPKNGKFFKILNSLKFFILNWIRKGNYVFFTLLLSVICGYIHLQVRKTCFFLRILLKVIIYIHKINKIYINKIRNLMCFYNPWLILKIFVYSCH